MSSGLWRGDPAFRPGRKRRFTSPEISVVFASVFACPGIVCSLRPPRRQSCGTTARTPGSCGTWPSSSTGTGTPAGRPPRPTWARCRQLAAARAEHDWLAAGSQTVQQQALRDFAQAMAVFFDQQNPGRQAVLAQGRAGRESPGGHRRARRPAPPVPAYRRGAGYRGPDRVRFRWSRAVPPGVKSYRVRMDRAGRWHVAFAVIPEPVPAPGNGETVRHRPRSRRQRGPVDRRAADRAGAEGVPQAPVAATAAAGRPGPARVEPTSPGQARRRPAARPRDRCAQRLGREGLHRHRARVRPDQGRGPAHRGHDAVGEGNGREPGPERPRQGRARREICGRAGACWSAGGRTRRPAGWRRSSRITRASGARRAGRWMRSRARAKRASHARPAVTPATRR